MSLSAASAFFLVRSSQQRISSSQGKRTTHPRAFRLYKGRRWWLTDNNAGSSETTTTSVGTRTSRPRQPLPAGPQDLATRRDCTTSGCCNIPIVLFERFRIRRSGVSGMHRSGEWVSVPWRCGNLRMYPRNYYITTADSDSLFMCHHFSLHHLSLRCRDTLPCCERSSAERLRSLSTSLYPSHAWHHPPLGPRNKQSSRRRALR